MLTAFLSRADVSRHLQALQLLHTFREALRTVAPLPDASGFTAAATSVRNATWPTVPAFSVVVQTGLHKVLQLHEVKSGKLLAVMDAAHLSTLCASIVSALGIDVLAREDARHVAVLGSGTAASSALKAIRLVRSIQRVWLYEEDPAANTELAIKLQSTLATSVRGTNSAAEAMASADLVVLTGEVPLDADALRPGAHVSIVGDHPSLLPEALARRARVFDEAALAEVLAGRAEGRRDADEHTVFAAKSPAFLDLLCAWHAFDRARDDEALVRLDLEA